MKYSLALCLLGLALCEVSAKSTTLKAKTSAAPEEKAASLAEEEAAPGEEGRRPQQYPFRDLPADVLRDFPGLCFGSTALRLFHIGQSWSLTPFCGVASCLVSEDRLNLIERVQDCGPQPKKNPKCKNVNENSEAQFPGCCPVFECEDGEELEYPTQEELQALAHEAAQAAVRAQYNQAEEGEAVQQTARKVPAEETEEVAKTAEKTSDAEDVPVEESA